jgi:hypothetical protein
MAYIYNMADTWADAGTTFTAIKMNVLDTASNAASLLMDLQVGGSSRFSVSKDGAAIASVRLTSPNIVSSAYSVGTSQRNSPIFSTTTLRLDPDMTFAWATTANSATPDLILARDAADTLAQRRTTNAQTFRVYNTFTDASNYERGFIRYSSNQLEIGHEAAGTGSGDRLIVIRRPNAGTILDVVGASTISARIGSVSGFATAMGVGPNGASPDIFLFRRAAGVGAITGNAGGTTGAALEFLEQTAPAAPSANNVRIYAEDDGAGKTRLMALFATGAAVQIAIEP